MNKEYCFRCKCDQDTKRVENPAYTEWLCAVCGWQVDCDFEDDYGDEETWCHYCGGEGWGIEGEDWSCTDPLWISPGTVRKCPCCNGSGLAKDCTFW